MSDIADFMRQQEKDNTAREFGMAMERARNAMRAVQIALEEGDDEEALRLVKEALGDDV